jgi:hypothetical protein
VESRFPTVKRLDGELVTTASGASYRSLRTGSGASAAAPAPSDADRLVWVALPTDRGGALTYAEIATASGASIDQVENRLRKWWEAHNRHGLAREGSGAKGDPFRWYREH